MSTTTPFEVGKLYETVGGETVRIVGRKNVGKPYETVYSLEDGRPIHRYTNESYGIGRATGTNHNVPDQKNLIPYKPKTNNKWHLLHRLGGKIVASETFDQKPNVKLLTKHLGSLRAATTLHSTGRISIGLGNYWRLSNDTST